MIKMSENAAMSFSKRKTFSVKISDDKSLNFTFDDEGKLKISVNGEQFLTMGPLMADDFAEFVRSNASTIRK